MIQKSSARNRPALAQNCPKCQGKKIGISEAKTCREQEIFPYYCLKCRYVFSVYASRQKAERYGSRWGGLEQVQTVTQIWIADGRIDLSKDNSMQPCEVCGEKGTTEFHHWAPKHLFGDEAYKWPTGNLCRDCHAKWHRIVTPNMGT